MIEKQLEYIKSDNIHVKVHTGSQHVSDKFYEVGASSTGKYHPPYAQGPGGLYRHTRAAVLFAKTIFDLSPSISIDIYTKVDYEKDIVYAALILHDICKYGRNFEYEYTQHDHPVLASSLILEVLGNDDEDARLIANCVMTHMGRWTTSKHSPVVLPEPTTRLEQFVHVCDYLASRKYINIDFNI